MNNENVERKAFRPSELPRVLGVSRAKAYLMIADGTLVSVRSGRAIFVPVASVDRFLAGRGGSEAGQDR